MKKVQTHYRNPCILLYPSLAYPDPHRRGSGVVRKITSKTLTLSPMSLDIVWRWEAKGKPGKPYTHEHL